MPQDRECRGDAALFHPRVYHTPKSRALYHIKQAHEALRAGRIKAARLHLAFYRVIYESRPASTKRRWACGK